MDVTKEMYRKDFNYAYSIFEKACALYDADINDSRQILYWLIRDLGNLIGYTGFKDNGFKVIPSSPLDNNFAITAGYGMYEGKRLFLAENAPILPITDTQSNKNLCFVVSNLTATTLTDYRRNMIVNVHAGQTLFAHREGHIPRQYTIVSNTSTTFVFVGTDLVADGVTIGEYYMVQPSTPGADRNDAVLVNLFLDEVNSNEDSALRHNIGGQFTNEIRMKVRTCIEVEENIGVIATYTVPSDYIDLLGNAHTYHLIGFLDRDLGDAEIDVGVIEDARSSSHGLDEFVLRAGDTMEGDLDFDVFNATGDIGDIDFATGIISLMTLIKSREFQLTNASDETKCRIILDSANKPYTLKIMDNANSMSYIVVSAATPVSGNNLTTKTYVDNKIDMHEHPAYLTVSSFGRTYLDSMVSVVGVTWIGTVVTSHDWVHGLGDSFLNVQVQIKNGSGYWEDAAGDGTNGLNWVIKDADTIQFTNNTGADVAGADSRVVVFKAHPEITTMSGENLGSTLSESYSITKGI